MPIEILMPALSPTMTEGTLARWLKKEGEAVKPGEVIAEIETDKATMEVEAVDNGIIGRILVRDGTEAVKVNSLIALLLEEGEDLASLASYESASTSPVSVEVNGLPTIEPSISSVVNEGSMVSSREDTRIKASPLAKSLAAKEGISLHGMTGSGPYGRIIQADVLAVKANPNTNSAAKKQVVTAPVVAGSYGAVRNPEEVTKIPNNTMRKVIARRLTESKQTVPHFYLSVECELDSLLAMRSSMNAATDKDHPAYKLSVNDFVIKAVAYALAAVPAANASWSDEAILQYNNVDVSVAVAIDGGLITPIIRNADQKSLSVISNEMKQLIQKAKSGKLAPEEFQGGGFSISNLGMYGIKQFQAIVNPPQGCILAVGAGSERVVVKNKHMQIANVMDVSLSCDHRVVDGAVAAEFLAAFKRAIELPVSMLV
jgi:pyruvate dehydrogenase E2 component (dihydrolipoamide acetyltransferase)